jgi:FixJ family two-component response regulator
MVSIIDDDPFVRTATDGLVRSLGYRAATFASAEDYLQSDRINDTTCVITDVQMPGFAEPVDRAGQLHANDLHHSLSRRKGPQASP